MTERGQELLLAEAAALWRTLNGDRAKNHAGDKDVPDQALGIDWGDYPASRANTERLLATLAALPDTMPAQRAAMVAGLRAKILAEAEEIDTRGLENVLSALSSVPREAFTHPDVPEFAYMPIALSIGHSQTISHPYVVARMLLGAALPARANVLDIGTGSGYQAALLSCLAETVTSIEIIEPLALDATERLRTHGFENVEVRIGDGFTGAPDRAPFDAILIAAAAALIPSPLLEQLKPGGHLIMPVGPSPTEEKLVAVTKTQHGSFVMKSLGDVRFVPLTGQGARDAQISPK